MAGRKQHYIPQAFLKGFASKGSGTSFQVWVFPKDRDPYKCATGGIAAERDFYSGPSQKGGITLDDEITSYESDLTKKLHHLRAAANSTVIDPKIAAELVVHLSIRTAHIRDSMSGAFEVFTSELQEKFNDQNWVRRRMGLDKFSRKSLFVKEIYKNLEETNVPKLSQSGIAEIAFEIVQNKFSEFHERLKKFVDLGVEQITCEVPTLVMNAHRKVLTNNVIPPERVSQLSKLKWTLCVSDDEKFILPDCVAIAISAKGKALPLFFGDHDEPHSIAVPISTDRVLIGSNGHAFKLKKLNSTLAQCCRTFFVANEKVDHLGLVPAIDTWSDQFFKDAIAGAL